MKHLLAKSTKVPEDRPQPPGVTLPSHAAQVFAAANVNAMKLEAFKYYYAPAGPEGVAGICAKPTPEILKLQADVIAAVKPFLERLRQRDQGSTAPSAQ